MLSSPNHSETQTLRTFFDDLAGEWDAHQPSDRVPLLNQLLDRFSSELKQADSILDIGTGTGTLLTLLTPLYPQAKIIAIDLSPIMLSHARQKAPASGVCAADIHFSPFAENTFSVIICHNSLPHLYPLDSTLREIHRLLQPEGLFIIMHDLSRVRVNDIHQNSSLELIRQHQIPSNENLSSMLFKAGLINQEIEDTDSHFLVSAKHA
jgi:ubiquinone/menaquinone biosynthesis C-methylase UbiE